MMVSVAAAGPVAADYGHPLSPVVGMLPFWAWLKTTTGNFYVMGVLLPFTFCYYLYG